MGGLSSKAPSQFKCLVIGESGSGKTSFLNLLGNMKSVLDLAKKDELKYEMLHHMHRTANTEYVAAPTGSQTNKAHPHMIPGLGTELTIIDTPGFGDTNGLEADQNHVVSIEKAIEEQDAINCIVLVINGRVKVVSLQLRYVLANVCAILPKEILNQIVVVFTQVADPDDDLLFEPAALTEFFGLQLKEDCQLCIDNPYAKVVNLISKGTKNMDQKLRIIKGAFQLTADNLQALFSKISSFKQVGTNKFIELYHTKQEINKKAMMLNQQLANLNDDRTRAQDLKSKLSNDETAMSAVKDFEKQKPVEYWDWEQTKDRHHMICGECKSNCHTDCKIPFGMDKARCFKDCERFMWRTRKFIDIQTEQHRQQLLINVHERTANFVDIERTSNVKEQSVQITEWDKNFTVAGHEVRGNPDQTWLNGGLSRLAYSRSTLAFMRSEPVPFTCEMCDWSNVERGLAMECNVCTHSLENHSHQTCLHVKKTKMEDWIDVEMKEQYTHLTDKIQRQEVALATLNAKLEAMEMKEQQLKNELKTNLEKFKTIAASSSYISLLNEQKSYLRILLKQATQKDAQATVSALNDQIKLIETMTQAITKT